MIRRERNRGAREPCTRAREDLLGLLWLDTGGRRGRGFLSRWIIGRDVRLVDVGRERLEN